MFNLKKVKELNVKLEIQQKEIFKLRAREFEYENKIMNLESQLQVRDSKGSFTKKDKNYSFSVSLYEIEKTFKSHNDLIEKCLSEGKKATAFIFDNKGNVIEEINLDIKKHK